MNFAHNFTVGAPINRAQQPLTIEALKHYAPSAFATAAHESRSARYTYIPTVEVIAGLMREGFQPFKATQSRTRVEGKSDFTKHMIRFRHASQTQMIRVGDVIPEIVLINSHDGTSAYQISLGMYRLACSNGLMVAESTIPGIKVHHKGNIVDSVVEGSFEIVKGSEKAVDQIDGWRRLELTAGEQNAFAEAAHAIRFGEAEEGEPEQPIQATQLLRARRNEDVGPDLWKTLNRVQENTIRGGLRGIQRDGQGRRVRRVSTREVKGIDQDVKLNRALWILADRMAALKTA